MSFAEKQTALLDKIRTIEKKFATFVSTAEACGRESTDRLVSTGWKDVDDLLGGGLVDSGLHEWFGIEESAKQSRGRHRNDLAIWRSGDLAIERNREPLPLPDRLPLPYGRGSVWTPPLCILVHLAWLALDRSITPRWAVWIGRRCFPYPRVLVRGQQRDARLLDRSIFVAPRDAAARLWAADLAVRSPATAVVVVDGSAWNMPATRRLHLAARREHKWMLVARPPQERTQLSAAHSRWLVRWPGGADIASEQVGAWDSDAGDTSGSQPSAAPSERTLEESAVIHGLRCAPPVATARRPVGAKSPGWSMELLRCKGVQLEKVCPVWALEWNRAEGIVDLSAPLAGAAGDAPPAAGDEESAGRRIA